MFKKTIDLSVYIVPFLLLVLSVAMIYSLVLGTSNNSLSLKQAIVGLIGVLLMLFISFVDYRFFRGTAWVFYFISIGLLILLSFIGKTVNGAISWIDLGFFQLQPSEVAKLFSMITLSSFLSGQVGKVNWKVILVSLFIILPPLALILREPDFGSALVVSFVYFVLILATKPTRKQLIVIFSGLFILITCFYLAYANIKPLGQFLHDYQRQRVNVFLNPELDPYGRGYNVKQAQIAAGSGGLIGRGLGKGTQSQLQFLPEPYTDFIFSGIAESFGFLGSFIVLALYCYFFLRLLDIACLARDNFGMLLVFGTIAMFAIHVIINIGMNLGMVPVTGIPLPFLSSGGTFLLISFFAVGLVQSILIRHKKITF